MARILLAYYKVPGLNANRTGELEGHRASGAVKYYTYDFSLEMVDAPQVVIDGCDRVKDRPDPNGLDMYNKNQAILLYSQYTSPIPASIEQFEERYNRYILLRAVLDVVVKAKNKLMQVEEGQFDVLGLSELASVDTLTFQEIEDMVIQAKMAKAVEKAEEWNSIRQQLRSEISDLIADQNAELSIVFEEAADAAKTNKMIGLLRAGLNAAAMYYRSEQRSRDLEQLSAKLSLVSSEISAQPDRSPASENVVEGLNTIVENISWFGGIYNAKRQTERLNNSVEMIALSLPKGETRSYLVILKGNNFHLLVPADSPQAWNGQGTRVGATYQIVGKGQ